MYIREGSGLFILRYVSGGAISSTNECEYTAHRILSFCIEGTVQECLTKSFDMEAILRGTEVLLIHENLPNFEGEPDTPYR